MARRRYCAARERVEDAARVQLLVAHSVYPDEMSAAAHARMLWDPPGFPIVRVIVAMGRSGSTALLRAFANHPDAYAMYQPIRFGKLHEGVHEEDYRLYDHHPVFEGRPDKVFVAKEVTPWLSRGRPVVVFRTADDMRRARPVFLVRDPLRTWRSLAKLIGDNAEKMFDHFISTYREISADRERCHAADPSAPLVLTFERLLETPEHVLARLCEHWGLRAAPDTLRWNRPLDHNMWLPPYIEKYIDEDPRWWSSVRSSATIDPHAVAADEPPLAASQQDRLAAELGPVYRLLAEQCARDFAR